MNNELLQTIIVGILSGGIVSALLNYLIQHSKNKIDMVGQVYEMALKLLEPYKKRVRELEECQEALEEEVAKLRKIILRFQPILDGANQLYTQVKGMGGEPGYKPPTQSEFEAGPRVRRKPRDRDDS
jgi:hypothetical protein